METPTPVNLNLLKGILGNAKKLMNKVENNDYTTGHVDARALNEDGIAQLQNEGVRRPSSSPTQEVSDYTEEQVRNSKLPQAIKEAMINKKIPKVSMANTSFSLEDVSDLVEKPMGLPKTPIRRPVNETVMQHNSDMITINKTELKSMINESLAQFFKTSYDKTLTEDAIKKTINMLIKEGKITVKAK